MDYDRIIENIKFRIDDEKYFETPQYLDILNLEIPVEHYNGADEKGLEYLLTDDIRERLSETYENRRKDDVRIMHMSSELEQENRLIEIYNRELSEFFERFPQFRIILEED